MVKRIAAPVAIASIDKAAPGRCFYEESVERNRQVGQVLSIGNRKIVTDAANSALVGRAFQNDLAEMLVCFHVREGFCDLFEGVDAVDAYAQLACGHCVAKVSLHQSGNLAYLGYRARAERDLSLIHI